MKSIRARLAASRLSSMRLLSSSITFRRSNLLFSLRRGKAELLYFVGFLLCLMSYHNFTRLCCQNFTQQLQHNFARTSNVFCLREVLSSHMHVSCILLRQGSPGRSILSKSSLSLQDVYTHGISTYLCT